MVTRYVLIIEDNKDNRTLIKFVLENKTDWKVLTACDGIEGITKAQTIHPDVILLDFIMPDLDGLAVLKILKSNLFTCSIPVIFITAMVDDESLSQLKNTLAEGVITKPFDAVNLNSQIAEICEWKTINY